MDDKSFKEIQAEVARDIAAGKAKLAHEAKLQPFLSAERLLIQKLYYIRIKKYPDQTEFATVVGWTQGNVSRFENRRNKPTLRTVVQYCLALGIELSAAETKGS